MNLEYLFFFIKKNCVKRKDWNVADVDLMTGILFEFFYIM